MSLDNFGATLVLAPHPDDETLGCGATLLRIKRETSHPLYWIMMTRMSQAAGYDQAAILKREQEIKLVSAAYGFDSLVQLPFQAAMLDGESTSVMVRAVADVLDDLRPTTILMPFPGDAHSDHARTFKIASACSKWFRRRDLRRIMCYEVLSETGFGLNPTLPPFSPNCFVQVDEDLVERIEIMNIYGSEMAPFPFPRSDEAIRSLARLRGSECGSMAAEAFLAVREIV